MNKLKLFGLALLLSTQVQAYNDEFLETFSGENGGVEYADCSVDMLTTQEKKDLQWGECASQYSVGSVGPAGGWVFSISDDGYHGLEAAPKDVHGKWNCYGKSLEGKALRRGLGEGRENTREILDAGCGGIAALADNYAVNGYDDWYLPSHGELELMWTEIREIGDFQLTGGFPHTLYWTSTTNETYKHPARASRLIWGYVRDFTNGWSNLAEKTFNFRARPMRDF
ncbi:trimeric autotransporter adhesin [Bathymodiolus platifrons methanotrophic gill symbiont]|uniref:DUF1566 domain-containing protein n=1 Tax=Bathymodiolus platifrons methanotrophic gill symbiont TaxID=113268 RepID=UPI001B530CCC|nr:DUF1566 domain-containing protein [Bathymodiolus platifrons methanotrophic gill symbiont]GFO76809.1 trimeric autotransporter adhesin [Bathymodiolus platifrons methanotrophic gill symbiont]